MVSGIPAYGQQVSHGSKLLAGTITEFKSNAYHLLCCTSLRAVLVQPQSYDEIAKVDANCKANIKS